MPYWKDYLLLEAVLHDELPNQNVPLPAQPMHPLNCLCLGRRVGFQKICPACGRQGHEYVGISREVAKEGLRRDYRGLWNRRTE